MATNQLPYPYTSPARCEAERDLDNQANRETMRHSHLPPAAASASVDALRDAVLHAMAPPGHEGPFYDPAALELLTAFEAAQRRAWEHAERGFVRQKALHAIQGALGALRTGQLI